MGFSSKESSTMYLLSGDFDEITLGLGVLVAKIEVCMLVSVAQAETRRIILKIKTDLTKMIFIIVKPNALLRIINGCRIMSDIRFYKAIDWLKYLLSKLYAGYKTIYL